MAMYDMMRNPQLPMETILERQHAIGGNIVNYEGNGTNQWSNPYYKEKARTMEKFLMSMYSRTTRRDTV